VLSGNSASDALQLSRINRIANQEIRVAIHNDWSTRPTAAVTAAAPAALSPSRDGAGVYHVYLSEERLDDNHLVWAWIRGRRMMTTPPSLSVGGAYASGLTNALRLSKDKPTFKYDGASLVVDKVYVRATLKSVSWKLEIVDLDSGEQAYAITFEFPDVLSAADIDSVREQLDWGRGITLEVRGLSASEQITVRAMTSASCLLAELPLEAHNIGEANTPVIVTQTTTPARNTRFSVRFYPGQMDGLFSL
jgi:hypothetical protein